MWMRSCWLEALLFLQKKDTFATCSPLLLVISSIDTSLTCSRERFFFAIDVSCYNSSLKKLPTLILRFDYRTWNSSIWLASRGRNVCSIHWLGKCWFLLSFIVWMYCKPSFSRNQNLNEVKVLFSTKQFDRVIETLQDTLKPGYQELMYLPNENTLTRYQQYNLLLAALWESKNYEVKIRNS